MGDMGGAGQDSPGNLPAGTMQRVPARSHWLGRRVLDTLYLVRAHRPIGIWLLLWPTLWAIWVASGGHPAPRLLLIFIAGTVLMRSAGCVINDLCDIDIDPHVRRTRDRPLAARRLAPQEAVGIFLVLATVALVLALQLNALTVKYSLVGAALTVTYPLLKRFFPIPQLYLGLAFGWAIPMAFAAQLGEVPRVGWVMMLAAVVWAGVYDSFYAIADRPDDLRIGVKSSAITFGDMDLVMIGAMQVMVLAALGFTGRLLGLGTPYFFCLGIGAAMFALQQWRARKRDAEGCLWAFNNNNVFGLVVLAGLIVDYSVRH
jgi:4-hydroxybenzoate polyprenyltransferase